MATDLRASFSLVVARLWRRAPRSSIGSTTSIAATRPSKKNCSCWVPTCSGYAEERNSARNEQMGLTIALNRGPDSRGVPADAERPGSSRGRSRRKPQAHLRSAGRLIDWWSCVDPTCRPMWNTAPPMSASPARTRIMEHGGGPGSTSVWIWASAAADLMTAALRTAIWLRSDPGLRVATKFRQRDATLLRSPGSAGDDHSAVRRHGDSAADGSFATASSISWTRATRSRPTAWSRSRPSPKSAPAVIVNRASMKTRFSRVQALIDQIGCRR